MIVTQMQHIRALPIILLILFAACSSPEKSDNRPVISVSILPQKYMVERIAGDNFRINVLVPPGASPETYEPTPAQMQDVARSILYLGVGYIDFERTLLDNIMRANNKLAVQNTAQGMEMIAAEVVEHGDHVHLYGVDPHIWLSVPGVRIQADNILNAIASVDPENKEYYFRNHQEFTRELDELHVIFTRTFNNVKRRTFLVYHPALGYFARDYGLNQIAVEQDGKNPTVANMRKIVDLARREDLRDVLIQMEFERDNARAVARELGGDVILIDPLSEDWMSAMKDIADKLSAILNK
jgi:zinc transport system substrate-binding protein